MQGISRRSAHLGSVLQIQTSELPAVQKHDLALIGANESQDSEFMQPRQRPGHCFQGLAEIIGNVAPGHGQRDDAGRRQPPVHLSQEGGDALQRSLATEQEHVVFGMLQVVRSHAKEVSGDHGIVIGHQLEATPFDQAHRGFDDCFRREPVLAAVFQSKDIRGEVKGPDLATAVRKQLVASHRTNLDLIDVIRRLLFALDFGPFFVGKFV